MATANTFKRALSFPPQISLTDIIVPPDGDHEEAERAAQQTSGQLQQWMNNVHQAIDDQGIWTPVFTGLTGGFISNTLGTYTRVGNVVFVTCQGTGANITFNGATKVSGLPYQVKDTYQGTPIYLFTGYCAGGIFPGWAQNVLGDNATSIYMAPGAAGAALGSGIYLTGWYEVNQNG